MGISYSALDKVTKTFLPVDVKDIKLTDGALRIHRSALVVDGHNDLLCKIRLKGPSTLETVDLMTNQPEFQTDIPRLIKGGIGAQFWAVVGWAGKQPDGRSGQSICFEEIDLIHKIAGIDHAGLGSDFDGISYAPDFLKDVSYFPYITQVLLNRGYKEEAIHKILGGNFLRVFRKAEEKVGSGRT
jgi:microsomal dipeptidase-like Zn-dependent dipeptidase